jgi:prepilin-type N-terminal cleavage/methylation domain-containing protein
MKALIKRYKEEGAEGFTLIELLIVIVILGILSTVVVFAVQGITNKGQGASCSADKNTLQVAVESYYANYGTYPTSQDQLLAPGTGTTVNTGAAGLLRTKSANYTVETVTANNVTTGTGKVVLLTNAATGAFSTATSVAGNPCTN